MNIEIVKEFVGMPNQRINLKTGGVYTGVILKVEDGSVLIKDKYDQLVAVNVSEIKRIFKFVEKKRGDYNE